MISGKVWGTTMPIFQTPFVKSFGLKIKAGGFSSEHRHRYRSNYFFIATGRLRVLTWMEKGKAPDVIELRPFESTCVPPGLWHKFEALEASIVVESYVGMEADNGDIERRTRGGLGKG